MRESWGRVRKWVQIIMMLTGPVVLAIALCNVTSEKLWQARAEEVQQIKKEKGLNGENSVRRAVALEKIQWEKAEKVYDGKREAVLTGYYQEKKEENRVTVEVQLEGSNVKTYTEAVIQKVIKQPQNYELAECEQKKISGNLGSRSEKTWESIYQGRYLTRRFRESNASRSNFAGSVSGIKNWIL